LPRPLRERVFTWRWAVNARRILGVPRKPETFNEKTRFKMVADRRPLVTVLSDKVAAREYVARALGASVLPELYLVTDDPRDIRDDVLPREFAMKAAHASGGSVLVAEFAPGANRLRRPPAGWPRLLVRPEHVDWGMLRGLCREWISTPFRAETQWANRMIPRRVVVEELLAEDGRVPSDFKLFTFHGRVRMISVNIDRYGGHVRSLYTQEWKRLPFELNFPDGPEVERPPELDEMIRIAERLSCDLDFLRVDLYVPDGRIVVGELTSFHGAGEEEFRPRSYDRRLGSWWSLPRRYR
jgi:hypothetical protein